MQRKGRYQPVSIEIGTCHAYNNNGDEDSDNEKDNTAMATRMTMTETEIPPSALSSSMSLDEATSIASISAEETLFVKRNKRRRRQQQQQHNITIRFSISFWILGLLNNTGYVIMIAAAKSISEGGVALVFLANILPALVVKGTAPYWFDYVSYKTRITVATILMVISFALVASSSSSLPWQLTGVAFTSAQGALGEASLLALAGKIDGSIASSESDASSTEDEINIRRRKQQQRKQQRRRQEVVNGTIDNNQQCDIDDEDDVNHSANINQNDEYIINNNDQNEQQQQHQQQRHLQKQSEEEENGRCLTGFSSGTGFAGVFGFFWKWFWNKWLGLSLSTTLWLATILAVGYLFAYRYVTYLQKQQKSIMTTITTTTTTTAVARDLVESSHRQKEQKQCYRDRIDGDHEDIIVACCDNNSSNNSNNDPEEVSSESSLFRLNGNKTIDNNNDYDNDDRNDNDRNDNDNNNGIEEKLDDETMMVKEISTMNGQQRFHLVLSLWPYMIPLFLVYLAEYTLQSGAWSAIGFPVTDRESRDIFYEYSNWMYQAGVFFSRSSGTFFLAPMAVLWIMPILQVINVGIYWAIAANQEHDANNYDDSGGFFYGPTFLYSAAFYTGLLGGAVYIHGYLRICRDLPLAHREFALSATSLAECLGIVVADFFGLLVQACLYRINNLEGAVINCPSSFN